MELQIRKIIESDIDDLYNGYKEQGWNTSRDLFVRFLEEQKSGQREVFVAVCDGRAVGYTTLLPNDEHGPFANKSIPTLSSFDVLESYQGRGIGTALIEEAEKSAMLKSDCICLGVGLHRGYGPAQRIYVKRGYVPDGSGIWYNNKRLGQNEPCINNDDLVLYMIKHFD